MRRPAHARRGGGRFAVASGAPELVGETYAVQIVTEVGEGRWLRWVVGVLEVAGGIGLVVPRLAGAAALGLLGITVFAVPTQLFLLDSGSWFTPAILGALLAVIVVARRAEIGALPGRGPR